MDLRTAHDRRFARARAYTDETPRVTFAASGLSSFREYNQLYEAWLSNRYRDDIQPFTNRSIEVYDPYLTETALGWMADYVGRIAFLTRNLEELGKKPGFKQAISDRWRATGYLKREEIVLQVLEDQCSRTETGDYIWTREDCPELTLEWATGFDQDGIPNWVRLWEQQGQTEEERKTHTEEGLPFRNLRNEKWDRVNGVFEIETSPLPVKKSVRAFVQDGVIRRNQHLRQFLFELIGTLSGTTVKTPPSVQRSSHPEETDENDMLSVDCQHQHWKVHKVICGKPLKETFNVPSFASPSTSSPSKSSIIAHLSTSIDRLKLTSQAPALYLKQKMYNLLLQNECACWIQCRGDPDQFDPREPLEAIPVDVTGTGKSRLQLRLALRSIALDFLKDEGGNERLLDLAVLVVSVIDANSDSRSIHARWLAKMVGLEGNAFERFADQEFSERLARGREVVRTDAQLRVIEECIESREADPSDSVEYELVTIASQIRDDLENDPEAIWYTSSPSHPELTIAENCMRIGGPVLTETSKSEYTSAGQSCLPRDHSSRAHDWSWAPGSKMVYLAD
ncbi:hypothetical protein JCM3765_007421 [Sporobolomyces pararoseus]